MLTPPGARPEAFTPEEKLAVSSQLERLLASVYFSHSRRFPSFLRFVVEKTLAGQEDDLKERTIGIEIFRRPADYDTATDPIVRVTAAEIRKRIAQYYQDSGHEAELRIALPPGSYIPQFADPAATREETSPPQVLAAASETAEPARQTPAHHHFWRGFVVSLVVVSVVATAAIWGWRATHRSPFDFFWGPVLTSSDPVLFCVADQNQYSDIALRDADDPNHQIILKDNLTAIVWDDLSPIVKIAGVLQANGKKYSLKGESSANLMDLRAGSTVFIGAFDNAWTLRLTRSLRYHFFNNADMTQLGILDSKSPDSRRWYIDRRQQMATNNYSDYAIVARFTDPTTGKLAVIAAGVGRGGTIVAGEFLTDPDSLSELMRAAKAAGNKQNMEIVLSTPIIGGEPGSPNVEATYFW